MPPALPEVIDFFPGIQFPQDKDSLNQFFRQMTPNTGPFDVGVISDAVAALHDKVGSGILVTHSQGGGPGWHTAMKSDKVSAIVAYEPGSGFVFPEGEVPEPIPNKFNNQLVPTAVPVADFKKLTQMPVIIYYGDNIPDKPSYIPAQDYWRASMEMANKWAATINRHGGDAPVVHLPIPEPAWDDRAGQPEKSNMGGHDARRRRPGPVPLSQNIHAGGPAGGPSPRHMKNGIMKVVGKRA